MIKERALNKFRENVNDQSFNDGDLGGCNVDGDPGSECPKMWKYIIDKYDIKSVIDVGCGFGYHLKYFKDFLGLKITGIEGSKKVQEISFFPDNIKCHDYSAGEISVEPHDLCWSIEFVEHVDSKYIDSFLKTFACAKYLIMTHAFPGQGGHHHVNEESSEYWIRNIERVGFKYDDEETQIIRKIALEDFNDFRTWQTIPITERPMRGVASEANCNVGFLLPHVAENALFFKK